MEQNNREILQQQLEDCDPFYSEANMKRLREAAARLDAGLGTEHELIEETPYLLSVPGMKGRLLEGLDTPIEGCDDFKW